MESHLSNHLKMTFPSGRPIHEWGGYDIADLAEIDAFFVGMASRNKVVSNGNDKTIKAFLVSLKVSSSQMSGEVKKYCDSLLFLAEAVCAKGEVFRDEL
jgi:hypothetical protein